MRKEKLSKASITVEAALLVPIITITIIGMIYLFGYVHNRAFLSAAACECALSGADCSGESLFAAESVTCRADETKGERTVSCHADMTSVIPGWNFSINEAATRITLDPLTTIWVMQAGKELINGGEET